MENNTADYLTGLELAVVGLCRHLAEKGLSTREEMALAVEATGKSAPSAEAADVCSSIAEGIRIA